MTLLTLNLEADGLAEARRLAAARTWLRDGDEQALLQIAAAAPVVARARNRNMRRQLGGRMLLIVRLSSLDASGRIVESQIAGVLVTLHPCAAARRRARVRAAIAVAARAAQQHLHTLSTSHRQAAFAVAGRFSAARAARHRAIADRTSRAAAAPCQAGLFDRRAERARDLAAAAASDRERRLRDRVRASDQAAIASQATELVLVLTP
jgi:hypothetical protein